MNGTRAERDAPAATSKAIAAAALAALVAASCLAVSSCGNSRAAKESEQRRIAGLRAEVAALEGKLKDATNDEARVELLRSILDIEVMRSGDLESGLKRYSKNEGLLSADAMSRVYAAVAESMMAGKAEKIEDKLSWLMKGMRSFDELREEYPEDESVLLYQASTYANFPAEVGARDEVLDIMGAMAERYAAGDWNMSEGVAAQAAYVYKTLESIYSDAESLKSIRESRESFAAAVPASAAALAAPDPRAAGSGDAR